MAQRPLLWILDQTRAEAKLALGASLGQNIRGHLIAVINRVQNDLWTSYAWPLITRHYDKTLSAGERYYDLPTGVPANRIRQLYTRWDLTWLPVTRGLAQLERGSIDPDLNQRSDPPLLWEFFGETQIEIWPLPATDGGLLRFRALAEPAELVDDADMSALDGFLIALYVAAEATTDPELAKRKQLQADARLARLRANYATAGGRSYVLGGSAEGGEPHAQTRPAPWVAVDRGT